jgi:hypothetical protein
MGEKRNEMDEKRSAGLRLPVQAAVDRTATHATLAQDACVEASWCVGNPWNDTWICSPGPPALMLLRLPPAGSVGLTAQLRCYVPEPVDEAWAGLRHLGRVPWIFEAGSCRPVRCLTD